MSDLLHCEAVSRRTFLQGSSLLMATAAVTTRDLLAADPVDEKPLVRFGLVTDLHYADKAPAGSRHYRDSFDKLTGAAAKFGDLQPQFVVELGDLVDAAPSAKQELAYLKKIDGVFASISKERHYVLGNHCVATLSKEEFLDGVERKKSYYSFDAGDHHFVVLDACFLGNDQPYRRNNFEWNDANVPPVELEWLKADLHQTKHQTIVFVHQRLDDSKQHAVKNASAVRRILEESGRVLAVFQGHSHQNDHQEIAGIHYCTLRAMVEGAGIENNAFTQVDVLAGGVMRVTGFDKQSHYQWKPVG